MKAWVQTETAFGSVAIDPAIGNLRHLQFHHAGREIAPLHAAHWIDAPDLPGDLPPVERRLAGDFFCAPFGASDVDPAPPHGWSANSAWHLHRHDDGELVLSLEAAVLGARIDKSVRLAPDAPLLYQTHHIHGGDGGLTVAHHPMVNVAAGATLSTSPKYLALTPDAPLDPDRNALACPGHSSDLRAFPARAGGTIDLTQLPIAEGTEDFVTLIEAVGAVLGWTAILRHAEDDIVFVLKDPRALPVTMLWHSNGGRDHAPWNGQHTGVLGIEDGCAAGVDGHQAALVPNRVSHHGVPTFLRLNGTHRIAHVIGAVARPEGWKRVADIRLNGQTLTLEDQSGATLTLPFDPHFFTEAF